MLQVLMRVEQEQKVTEDARASAEQDAAAQRYAVNVLQVLSLLHFCHFWNPLVVCFFREVSKNVTEWVVPAETWGPGASLKMVAKKKKKKPPLLHIGTQTMDILKMPHFL